MKYSRKHWDVIAWAYDADYHCPACAVARFGESKDSPGGLYPWLPEDAQDNGGDNPSPIFAGSEWYDYFETSRQELVCPDCHGIIDVFIAEG